MAVEHFLNKLNKPKYKRYIEHIEIIEPRGVEFQSIEYPLPDVLQSYLEKNNFELYSHQAETLNYIRQGKNVILTTPTASGKTLSFNLPVFETLLTDKKACALYLYPMKALTNDQLKALHQLEQNIGVDLKSYVYDGDTPQTEREMIKENVRICLSNPYTLHLILKWHTQWIRFYSNLKYIIIDEAHGYNGIFGANIGQLLRRLLRICERYGSHPQIIMASATVANPIELANRLTGQEFELVSKNGSPSSKKYFILFNPFKKDIQNDSIEDTSENLGYGYYSSVLGLFIDSIDSGLQTLCFSKSRKGAEQLSSHAQNRIRTLNTDSSSNFFMLSPEDIITPYRSGYSIPERKRIENEIKDGKLRGIVSTNALEVGIDIGGLDAVIMMGFPNSMMSLWQQAGRCGRSGNASIVVLIASNNMIDQYYMNHPDLLFSKSTENAIIDLKNDIINKNHLICAASEFPLLADDKKTFRYNYNDYLLDLEIEGKIKRVGNRDVFSCNMESPAMKCPINSFSNQQFRLYYNNSILETLSPQQAYNELYVGAVYTYYGNKYRVKTFNAEKSYVVLEECEENIVTIPINDIEVEVLSRNKSKIVNGLYVYYGNVKVSVKYTGYMICDEESDRIISQNSMVGHMYSYKTKSTWIELIDKLDITPVIIEKGIYGVRNAIKNIIPLFIMCGNSDYDVLAKIDDGKIGYSSLYIIDNVNGGNGISEKIFNIIIKILKKSNEIIRECRCQKGCPSCIVAYSRYGKKETVSKKYSRVLSNLIIRKQKDNKKSK